jgi:hypothetical protein
MAKLSSISGKRSGVGGCFGRSENPHHENPPRSLQAAKRPAFRVSTIPDRQSGTDARRAEPIGFEWESSR